MKKQILTAILVLGLGGTALIGCDDDGDGGTKVTDAGGGGFGNKDGGFSNQGGSDANGIVTPTSDGGITPGGSDGSVAADGGTPTTGDAGALGSCFSGTPTTNLQFLNACTAPGTVDLFDKPNVVLPNGAKVGDPLR